MDHLPQAGAEDLSVKRRPKEKLIEHKCYIDQHGEDLPEIRNWTWDASASGAH